MVFFGPHMAASQLSYDIYNTNKADYVHERDVLQRLKVCQVSIWDYVCSIGNVTCTYSSFGR